MEQNNINNKELPKKQPLIKIITTFILKNILTFLQGFAMGVANIIPGISGGTVILVMGLYDKFIQTLSNVSKWITSIFRFLFGFKKEHRDKAYQNFKAVDWVWAIFLFVGRGLAILIISSFMKFAIDNYPSQTYGAFFGLILASVIIPFEKMEKKGLFEFLALIIGFALLFWFSGLEAFEATNNPSWILLPIAGIIATSAMILPGISGSFLLVMLGVHSYIFGLAPMILQGKLFTFEVAIPLILYAIGWIIGILSFSRFLNFFLKKFHSVSMGFLIGLMLGSLRKIYPFLYMAKREDGMTIDRIPKLLFWNMPEELPLLKYLSSFEFISVMICLVTGIALVLTLHFISRYITAKKRTLNNG